jgi:galactofuranosylgalactofuranosylrhamnosyl-N-acetylglucosaminyl-diphospho-decaprenol beta-1,5/1,6-galactofuranosyltransferase
VTLEITTMNKPDFCVANITSLGQSPEALEHVKEVLIVDQGSQKVSDQAGFERQPPC